MRLGGERSAVTTLSVAVVYLLREAEQKRVKRRRPAFRNESADVRGGVRGAGSRAADVMDPAQPILPCPI